MNKISLCNDVSTALSCVSNESPSLHVSSVQLGMKASHEPTMIVDDLWGEAEVPRADEDSEADE